jgi:hypothetical protein
LDLAGKKQQQHLFRRQDLDSPVSAELAADAFFFFFFDTGFVLACLEV